MLGEGGRAYEDLGIFVSSLRYSFKWYWLFLCCIFGTKRLYSLKQKIIARSGSAALSLASSSCRAAVPSVIQNEIIIHQ